MEDRDDFASHAAMRPRVPKTPLTSMTAGAIRLETTNFKRETSLPNSSANTHLVERFTRPDANTLLYEFTVEDPTVWTRPWTAVVPMRKSEDPIYEYACHEGNYAMASILAGARAAEKAAEEAAKKGPK
jgi:hypothetical protein